jgi:hypothetical protein
MNHEQRRGRGFDSVRDPRLDARRAAAEAQRPADPDEAPPDDSPAARFAREREAMAGRLDDIERARHDGGRNRERDDPAAVVK